jgi:hypothetical protein
MREASPEAANAQTPHSLVGWLFLTALGETAVVAQATCLKQEGERVRRTSSWMPTQTNKCLFFLSGAKGQRAAQVSVGPCSGPATKLRFRGKVQAGPPCSSGQRNPAGQQQRNPAGQSRHTGAGMDQACHTSLLIMRRSWPSGSTRRPKAPVSGMKTSEQPCICANPRPTCLLLGTRRARGAALATPEGCDVSSKGPGCGAPRLLPRRPIQGLQVVQGTFIQLCWRCCRFWQRPDSCWAGAVTQPHPNPWHCSWRERNKKTRVLFSHPLHSCCDQSADWCALG